MASRFSVDAVFKAIDKVSGPVSRMQSRINRFTRSVDRGFRSANRGVDRINGSLARTGAVAGGALVAGAGTAILALNKVADAADNLAKTSRRIDFPIEDLQEWSFVATQSGVDTKLFESSLGAFTKRLGEARAGTGALNTLLGKTDKAFLEQLKSAESNSAAFQMLIDRMRNTENAADRAALASAAFSRAGLKLANISDNSADAIERLRKEQRANGVITMQQAKQMEAYNDAVDSLQRSIFGLQAEAVAPLAPELTRISKSVRGWVNENRKLISQRVGESIQFLTNNAESFGAIALGLIKILGAWLAITIALKIATIAFNAVMLVARIAVTTWAIATKVATVTFLAFNAALKTARAVMLAFNLVLAANPIGVVVAAVGLLIAGAVALWQNWDKVAEVMSNVWDGIKSAVSDGVDFVLGLLDKIMAPFKLIQEGIGAIIEAASDIFGGDSTIEVKAADRGTASEPQIVTAAEQTARSIEERRTTSSAELRILDETGRAKLTQEQQKGGPMISLEPSGAF